MCRTWGGGARHKGFQAPLDISLSKQVSDCRFFPRVFEPPRPLSLLLLSLTRRNVVVASVPAGCDSPLLLIFLNQWMGGFDCLFFPPTSFFCCRLSSLRRRRTKKKKPQRRMKHAHNLFKDGQREDGLSGQKAL